MHPCVWLSGQAALPHRWFSTEWSGSYGDAPSIMLCVSTLWNRIFINMSLLCLGVDVGFLGFVDCAGVPLFSEYGTDSIQAVPHIGDMVLVSNPRKRSIVHVGLFQHELTMDYCGLL